MDAQGWAVIIAAGFLGLTGTVTSVLGLLFGYLREKRQELREHENRLREEEREQAKLERDRDAAEKVEQVRLKTVEAAAAVREVKITAEEQGGKLVDKLDGLSKQVEEVHLATNGMKHELVEAVREASFAKGVKSELDKHGGQ